MNTQMLNTSGAATFLGISKVRIHRLVWAGLLPAYIYNDGILTRRAPEDSKRKGQGLYFYERDLKEYKPRPAGRPQGAKDRKPRVCQTSPKNTSNT